MDPNFPLVCAYLPIFSNGAAAFLHNLFFFSNDCNIYPNEETRKYLATLAGVDLDILIRGGGGGGGLTC